MIVECALGWEGKGRGGEEGWEGGEAKGMEGKNETPYADASPYYADTFCGGCY